MGKIFSEKLKVATDTHKRLLQFSDVYRIFYNGTLDVQLKNREFVQTREEQFMDLEDIDIEVTKLNIRFPFKYDMGIRASALIKGREAFQSWWASYLRHSRKPTIGSSPRFISKIADDPFFRTRTIVKVDKNGIYFPKLGYLKVTEKGYIPFGDYRNAEIKLIDSYWEVKLESAVEVTISSIKPKMGSLDIFVGYDGALQIQDTVFPSILEGKKYNKRMKKLQNYQDRFNQLLKDVKQNKEEFYKLKNRISVLISTLQNMRISYFGCVSNSILKAKPNEVTLIAESLSSGKLQNFSSKEHRQARTLLLVKTIKRKLELYGIKVKLEGIEPNILNSN